MAFAHRLFEPHRGQCPASANAQRHATAAHGAFADKLGGAAHVVATPSEHDGGAALADVAEAPSQEQVLSRASTHAKPDPNALTLPRSSL